MARVNTPRRYYHRKRMNARNEGSGELEGVWRYRQEECTPATALPSDFPYRAELDAHGYSVVEDLDGADEYELMQIAELTQREASDVLAALQPLLPTP